MSKEYAQKLKERGLCHNCCKPGRPGKTICAACTAASTTKFRERREMRRMAGLCWRCGAKHPAGKLCSTCQKRADKANLRRLAKKHALGICEHCDKPARPGHRKCEEHAKRLLVHAANSIKRRGVSPAALLRQWKRNNPEKYRLELERARAKVLANIDEVRRRERERTAAKPEVYRLKRQRREARKAGAKGDHTVEQWLARVTYHGWRCRWCGCELTSKTLTKDHIIALSRGGSNFASNLAPACLSCNSAKRDKPHQEFTDRLNSKVCGARPRR